MRGGDGFTNDAMRYGSKVDKDIELGESEDKITKHLLIFLPKYQSMQHEGKAVIKVGKEEVPLFGKYDGYDPMIGDRRSRIGDYKTGMIKWTQKRADECDQLTFYDLMEWISTGKQSDLFIHWMPTVKGHDGKIRATGEVVNFQTSRKLVELMRMQARIGKAAREISARYEVIIGEVFK